jgi:DNA repair protein RecO (recombination protein O)
MSEAALRPAGGRAPQRRRGGDARVDHQPGVVLHSYPWRETSLIVEVFTRDHGRVALVARGAKRPTSQFRGLLAPFFPLAVSWSGRNEIKNLVRVEWIGGLAALRGDALLAAFYTNELLVRLLARGDAHELLFARYLEALQRLRGEPPYAATLRAFELDLLTEIGYAAALEHCADDAPIDPEGRYEVDGQGAARRLASGNGHAAAGFSGRTLIACARREFGDAATAAEARTLLRQLIGYHLDGRPLNTRRILQDLKNL